MTSHGTNAWPCRARRPARCSAARRRSVPSWPAPPTDASTRLRSYGVHLGMAFQAVDDLLGIWGETAVTGKPVWSDLRQQKKTLPITAALASADGRRPELQALLAASQDTEDAAARAAELIDRLGGRDETERTAAEHLGFALDSLGGRRTRAGASSRNWPSWPASWWSGGHEPHRSRRGRWPDATPCWPCSTPTGGGKASSTRT